VAERGVVRGRWGKAVPDRDGRTEYSQFLPHHNRDAWCGQLARVLSRGDLGDGHRHHARCPPLRQHRGPWRIRASGSHVGEGLRAGA
jgi:hypothetical protein